MNYIEKLVGEGENMEKPKPKTCPYCDEKDELVWDDKRKEWACLYCKDDLDLADDIARYEQEEAKRSFERSLEDDLEA